MSFSISFNKSSRDTFGETVDAAVENPVQQTEQGKATIALVKDVAKKLAANFDGAFPVSGGASGHVCEESPGSSPTDSVSVYLSEVLPS